jgi:hypothetical protein
LGLEELPTHSRIAKHKWFSSLAAKVGKLACGLNLAESNANEAADQLSDWRTKGMGS